VEVTFAGRRATARKHSVAGPLFINAAFGGVPGGRMEHGVELPQVICSAMHHEEGRSHERDAAISRRDTSTGTYKTSECQ